MKAILVLVDALPHAPVRVEAAARLAEKFDATLIGLAAALPRMVVDPSGAVAAVTIAAERERIAADFRTAEASFRASAARTRLRTEWRSAFDFPASALIEAAAAADLILISRPEHGEPHDAYESAAPGDVLMGAGRPVLVLPPHSKTINVSDIVVAWKDTREARRAVSDALPLLTAAEKVVVLAFPETSAGEDGDISLANVEAYLKRHKVNVSVQARPQQKSRVEEDLFRFTSVAGSGLIVAGGYGHTRLREWMFGGVTRALLRDSPIPILLSH